MNRAPTGEPDSVAVRVGHSGSGTVVARDPDGDTLTYTLGQPPAHGTVVIDPQTGEYTYTPEPGYEGPDSFTVVITDGRGGTTTSTVDVTVQPNNEPTLPDYALTTPEDTPVGGQVTGVDLDGDSLTYVVGTPPSNGTVTVNPDGTYTYTPGPNFNGTDSFTVVVDDGNGGTATSTVEVTVGPTNDAPTVPNYTLTTPEDTPVGGQVTGVDLDGDSLTYVVGTPPANGTVTVNPDGTYTYTPGPDFNGTDSFTVVVDDGNGGTATSTVEVTVGPTNDAPTVPDYTLTTPEDTPVGGQVTGVDLDGDSLTYVVGTPPANGTVTVNPDGTYTYTPGTNFNGTDSFTVVVNDGNGGTATSTVEVTVGPTNDAPTVPNYTLTTPEDTPVGGQVTGVDLDGDSLTYVVGTPPANGTVTVNPDGTYTYTPGPDFNGTDSFTVVVNDGNGGTATSTVEVTVGPTNDAPTVPNYALTTPEDTPVGGQVTGVDLDGDSLTYVVGTPPANGTVTVNPDGTYTYTPGTNFNGTDSFTVVVNDGNGGTATSTVEVTINPVNDAPVFVGGDNNPTGSYSFSYDENSTEADVLGVVRATDVDGPSTTYAITAGNDNGWYAIDADGRITLTAAGVSAQANNYEAGPNVHTLTVRATDGAGGATDIAVNLAEQDLNEAPTVSATSAGPVYEDALPGGIYDGSDHSDVTQGTLSFADGDAGTVASDLVVSLGGPAGITSQGQPVTWNWDAASGTLTGSAVIGGVVTSIMTVQVGPVSETSPGNFAATYTATLTGPMDHPAGGADALSLAFTATVGDGVNNSAPATFNVGVQDDAPLLGDGQISVNVEPLQTNLMVVLDLSGSMAMETPTRLQRAKEAIQKLIEGYDDYGDVMIKLVTFSTNGQAYDNWMDAGTAISTINALSSNGTTNYWSALQAAMSATGYDSAGKLAGPDVQNVAYFFTDGEPNAGAGITPDREATWTEFLADRDINSYAVGIGNSLNAGHAAQVNPIAYDGSTDPDGTDKDGLIISDTSELDDVLQGTISPPAVGNLLTGGLGEGQGFGGDGGYVSTLSIDGDVYAYDTATGQLIVTPDGSPPDYAFDAIAKTLTVTTAAGGTLLVELETGEFNYQALPANYTETITYQVTDRDGDVSNVATQTLNVTFGNAAPPTAFSFMGADALGLQAVDGLEAQDDAGERNYAAWKADLLSSEDSSASSFDGLLNAAFLPAQTAMGVHTVTGEGSFSADSPTFVPPVATALDDELHHASAMYA
nr:Ig-like domain-containing protein [Variovorax paradoxus]